MRTTYDPNSYHPSAFDDDLCLRPPLLLWILALFLSRAILMPLVIGLGHYASVNEDAMRLLRAFWGADTLPPALLAVPVLYALLRRSPKASRATRWVWNHGRIFLCASLLADIAVNARQLIPFMGLDDQNLLPICGVVADVYFSIYVLAARRVRDTFSDFPPP